ncbi:homocysteine S-methyltransferase YbgG-like [Odontomachus brunneus]|uniref:homocysteine S-methyltransferase YbgG-like n=1 Tax=Odontomachus brunneus TaxID=486640 RepID=UPI0013F1EB63|nr:homocysteine S-methyltransferase YbgG-like [Odontomachus brunneus]
MENLIVVDGDFETQLRRNLVQREMLDNTFALQALLNNKYAVYQTHLDYLRAGAQIIRTNIYRTSLSKYCYLPQHENLPILHTSVQLAKQALYKYNDEMRSYSCTFKYRSQPLLAGSLSSYFSSFEDETNGLNNITNTSEYSLFLYHRQNARELLNAGVDLLAFESIPCMSEANAIANMLKFTPNIRMWITFSCQPNGLLLDGTPFTKAVNYYCDTLSSQICAIGAKCSLSSSMKSLMREINKKHFIPFVFYADKCHFSTKEANSASIAAPQNNFVEELFDCGVRYIGGGTNTVAEDIREIRKQADNYNSKKKIFTSLNSCSHQNTLNQSKL